MPTGRPTKYNDDIKAKAEEYINKFAEHDHAIPSVVGLAVVLEVAEKTLYNWGDKHPEFLQILERLNSKQHFTLVNGGLKGELNPSITKLVMGKHGYHEKQDHEMSGPGGRPIESKWTVEFVNASEDA